MTRSMTEVLRDLSQWYGTTDAPLTLSREEIGELIDAIQRQERQHSWACLVTYRLALKVGKQNASWLPTGSFRQWATFLATGFVTVELIRAIIT